MTDTNSPHAVAYGVLVAAELTQPYLKKTRQTEKKATETMTKRKNCTCNKTYSEMRTAGDKKKWGKTTRKSSHSHFSARDSVETAQRYISHRAATSRNFPPVWLFGGVGKTRGVKRDARLCVGAREFASVV